MEISTPAKRLAEVIAFLFIEFGLLAAAKLNHELAAFYVIAGIIVIYVFAARWTYRW